MLGGVTDVAYFSTGQKLNKTESDTFINLEYSFCLKTLTLTIYNLITSFMHRCHQKACVTSADPDLTPQSAASNQG